MSERWKPEVNERFWYITNALNICCTTNNDVAIDRCKIRAGNCFRTEAEAAAASQKVRELMRSLHSEPVTNCNQLPKLTAEVFDRPDCPEWAKYAAVDKNGLCFFYHNKPDYGVCNYAGKWYVDDCKYAALTGEKFDPFDWQNSLIERPAKLPEWCKHNALCYDGKEYLRIFMDGNNSICAYPVGGGTVKAYEISENTEARLRPYNADEIPDLPFEVSEKNSNFRTVVVSCKGDKVWLAGASTAISTEELMRDFTIDGSPCGVFEHLENGEWVE